MFLDQQTKDFYQSEKGKLYLSLNKIACELGNLINNLDFYYEGKIALNEIIKDIINITNDIKNETNSFDYRRHVLVDNWVKDYKIDYLLPLGHKTSLLALQISYSIDELLNQLDDEYCQYMYGVSCYLKQLFKVINELKGVSVLR
ncbi:MAG: hypothetical protein SO253_03510 [Bacilli bacterium]|nr:hypothetical protein [Bacilli bacterium]